MKHTNEVATTEAQSNTGLAAFVRTGFVAITAAGLALSMGLAGPQRAVADEDPVVKAKKALSALQEEAATADQKFSELQVAEVAATNKVKSITVDIKAQEKLVSSQKSTIGKLAVMQMQTAGVNATAKLLTSEDDSSFLNQLGQIQNMTERTNQKLQAIQLTQAKLAVLKADLAANEKTIAEAKVKQAQVVKDYDKKEAAATALVDRLTAEQKRKLAEQQAAEAAALQAAQERAARASASRTTTRPSTTATKTPSSSTKTTNAVEKPAPAPAPAPASSDRAAAAVAFAMDQLGKAYVYGATGPNAYDCSGLTQAAWRAAGVSISRTSQSQFSQGISVSASDLQPGDLVFYYSGISHVAIYIGNGKIVHASNPRTGVKISQVFYMPFMGARRFG